MWASADLSHSRASAGKVLDDAKTVSEVDIKEKDFVVVMFAVSPPSLPSTPLSLLPSPFILPVTAPCSVALNLSHAHTLSPCSVPPVQKVKPAPKAPEPVVEAAPASAASTSTPAAATEDAAMSEESAPAAAAAAPAPFSSQASFGELNSSFLRRASGLWREIILPLSDRPRVSQFPESSCSLLSPTWSTWASSETRS